MQIEVSNAEIIDKVTILLIKKEKCIDKSKLENINRELNYLNEVIKNIKFSQDLFNNLYEVNKTLWDIEDSIRLMEKEKKFNDEFIQLARSVYLNNDKRFYIKNKINELTLSNFKEEKILPEYHE